MIGGRSNGRFFVPVFWVSFSMPLREEVRSQPDVSFLVSPAFPSSLCPSTVYSSSRHVVHWAVVLDETGGDEHGSPKGSLLGRANKLTVFPEAHREGPDDCTTADVITGVFKLFSKAGIFLGRQQFAANRSQLLSSLVGTATDGHTT